MRFLLCLLAALGGLVPCTLNALPWREVLRQPEAWHASAEARTTATTVLRHQTQEGGWPKNTDLAEAPSDAYLQRLREGKVQPTIDNGGTTEPITFLARVVSAGAKEAAFSEAALRGLAYLLEAQLPSGGWPQFFPLRGGYHDHITFNDDAMVHVLELLREVANGEAPFTWVDAATRERARSAVQRGIACILATQVRRNGILTAWCAQHDAATLAPAWARSYESPSLSGAETVGIVRFLMEEPNPTPEIIASVEGAVAWLRKVHIPGKRVETFTNAQGARDRRLIADPEGPGVWPRFNDLEDDTPVFMDRDGKRCTYEELSSERRAGYAYLGTWPAKLLAETYPKWAKRHGLPERAERRK